MTSLPIPFIKRMQAQLGQEFEDFQASLDTIPPVSIRLNPNKNGHLLPPSLLKTLCKKHE